MRSQRLDITVPANGDYREEWQLRDNIGVAINLSSLSLAMKIRRVAGQGSALQTASVIIVDAVNGSFIVTIDGESLCSASAQTGSEIASLAYDLLVTYPDAIKSVPVWGHIYLAPGVTY